MIYFVMGTSIILHILIKRILLYTFRALDRWQSNFLEDAVGWPMVAKACHFSLADRMGSYPYMWSPTEKRLCRVVFMLTMSASGRFNRSHFYYYIAVMILKIFSYTLITLFLTIGGGKEIWWKTYWPIGASAIDTCPLISHGGLWLISETFNKSNDGCKKTHM